MSQEGTVSRPVYRKVEEGKGGATKTYMIVCDEGWRESIVCTGMYDWAAEIQDIMRVYREQEASRDGVGTPGGLEHMGDVWRLLGKWDRELRKSTDVW